MKTVGILGGLGPDTTAMFYLEINRLFKPEIQRPQILMWNVSIPVAIEEDLLIKGIGVEKYLPFLIDGAKRLEKGGADFIVIPCNTVHVLIDEIRKSVGIPVVSIIESTIEVLLQNKHKKVGLLSTGVTSRERLFEKKLFKNRIQSISVNKSQQHVLNTMIHKIVNNKTEDKDAQVLTEIATELKTQGADCIVLACTDLQQIMQVIPGVQIIDTMRVLAEASVSRMLRMS